MVDLVARPGINENGERQSQTEMEQRIIYYNGYYKFNHLKYLIKEK